MTVRRTSASAVGAFAVLAVLGLGAPGGAAPRIKVLKLAVTNAADEARPAENVTVRVSDLRAVAPDFRSGAVVVTTSEAATLAEDAGTLATQELASQADDLDGDGTADELAFQIDLGP